MRLQEVKSGFFFKKELANLAAANAHNSVKDDDDDDDDVATAAAAAAAAAAPTEAVVRVYGAFLFVFESCQCQAKARERHAVNQVEVKQEDSMAIHVLGVDRGIWFFELCVSPCSRLLMTSWYGLAWFSLLVFPWLEGGELPAMLPLLSIAASLGVVVRTSALTSLSLAQLLVRRWQFIIATVFLCVWLGLVCLTLRDARIAWALFAFVAAMMELFVDAQLTVPRRAGMLSRVWDKLNAGLFFAVLVCSFVVQNELIQRAMEAVGLYGVWRRVQPASLSHLPPRPHQQRHD